jgi:hypothetical protein
MTSTLAFDRAAAVVELGEPTGFELERDGARNLAFRGWKIGFGSHGNGSQFEKDWTRGTKVRIYLTTGGRLVTSVSRWSHWQGERSRFASAAHATPEAALAWLVEDAGGELGVASKEAWEAACSKWSALEGAHVEQVDAEPEPTGGPPSHVIVAVLGPRHEIAHFVSQGGTVEIGQPVAGREPERLPMGQPDGPVICTAIVHGDIPSLVLLTWDQWVERQNAAADATIRAGLEFIAPPKVKP